MSTIERSPGIPIGSGYVCGNGYHGATELLDATVQLAAETLAEAYSMPITIRFNSDRRSGGAWLKTDEPDGIWLNAEVGICASLHYDAVVVWAHVGKRVGQYAHEAVTDIPAALEYVQNNADLTKIRAGG